MQRDPNISKLDRIDPDANRELLVKLLRHSGKCQVCPVVKLLRLQFAETKRRQETDCGDFDGPW